MSNLLRGQDLLDDIRNQFFKNAVLIERLPQPTSPDDEQWSFPYGRVSFDTYAYYDAPEGTYTARFAVSGMVEESDLAGKFFIDHEDGFDLYIDDPVNGVAKIDYAEEDVLNALSQYRGGYEFWQIGSMNSDTFFRELLCDVEDEDVIGGGVLRACAAAIAEHVNYNMVMQDN